MERRYLSRTPQHQRPGVNRNRTDEGVSDPASAPQTVKLPIMNTGIRSLNGGTTKPIGGAFATGPGAASDGAPVAEATASGHGSTPPPQGTRRTLHRFATALLVALAAALPPAPAEAQTRTLVSNTGQAVYIFGGITVTNPAGTFPGAANQRLAQSFTTGDHPYGYVLESVELYLQDFNHDVQGADVPPTTVTVSVCPADESGNPGRPCHVLTNPMTFVDFGDTGNSNTFTAPPGTNLGKRKKYFVVAEATGGYFAWVVTESKMEDAGKAKEWSIGNQSLWEAPEGVWIPEPDELYFIAINGHEIDRTAPRVSSIERQTPTAERTNADSLTWRVTFTEEVENVTASDFTVTGTNAPITVSAVTDSDTAYDVQVTGGDLANLNARVTLAFAAGQDIVDTAGHDMVNTRPTGTNQSSYVVDNRGPELASATAKGTKLTLTFDEALDTSSKPAASAFTVKFSGTTQTLATTAVAMSGRKVTLTLPVGVTYTHGTGVTVVYEVPNTNPVKDLLGHSAGALGSSSTPYPVTNLSTSNATGKPRIVNPPYVGDRLHARYNEVGDPDGITLPADMVAAGVTGLRCGTQPDCAFQWIRVDGSDETDIAGATERGYVLTEEDRGKQVKVRLSFTDRLGNRETVTSDAYPTGKQRIDPTKDRTIGDGPDFNEKPTGAPAIAGTSQAGETLTASRGTIDDADGLPDSAFPTG